MEEKRELSESEVFERRKQKLIRWGKNPQNLLFLAILILGISIHIYHFSLTKNQPIWWDESDYMAYAKNLAGIGEVDWEITHEHNSLFPFVVAFFFLIGFSEAMIRFTLGVLPSIITILLVYSICNNIYDDKKIGLICAFLAATFWEFLFNSNRFHLENLSLLMAFIGIYIFFKGYEKKEKFFGYISPKFAIPFCLVFIGLSYSFRRGYFLFGLFLPVYMLLTRDFKSLIKEKYNWIGAFILIIIISLVEKFIFTKNVLISSASYYHPENPLGFVHLQVIDLFFRNLPNQGFSIFLYLLYLGLILFLINIFLHLGYIKKSKNKNLRGDLFMVLAILITFSYFILYQRDLKVGDPRWYFPVIFPFFVAISKSSIFLTDFIKKYNKYFAVIALTALIAYGGYYQYKHGDEIIKVKANSFNGIKQTSLMVKEISNPGDMIFVIPAPQAQYYSERSAKDEQFYFHKQPVPFEEFLTCLESEEKCKRFRFIIVTLSEPNHPYWMRQDKYPIIEIPFMDTALNLQTQQHDIKQTKTYGNITFNLLTIQDDAFLYEVVRKSSS